MRKFFLHIFQHFDFFIEIFVVPKGNPANGCTFFNFNSFCQRGLPGFPGFSRIQIPTLTSIPPWQLYWVPGWRSSMTRVAALAWVWVISVLHVNKRINKDRCSKYRLCIVLCHLSLSLWKYLKAHFFFHPYIALHCLYLQHGGSTAGLELPSQQEICTLSTSNNFSSPGSRDQLSDCLVKLNPLGHISCYLVEFVAVKVGKPCNFSGLLKQIRIKIHI